MKNADLNKLCMEESDPMLKVVVRDKEKVDPRSKFILPKLVNKIKELEEEVLKRQAQINDQVVDNNNGVGSVIAGSIVKRSVVLIGVVVEDALVAADVV
ncbi:hypothetical protein H5410_016270 [Solanum commersonii]|uniref:Uncharacterized protein n=1 Tax=Solanum commersonii TaxID=4109 RepID=A0A9J5ZVY2_SOLCO|nr:hypothetical protein H5410_016270 [Solanum commersonii]